MYFGCEGIGYLCPRTGRSRGGHGSPGATCVPGRDEVAEDMEVRERPVSQDGTKSRRTWKSGSDLCPRTGRSRGGHGSPGATPLNLPLRIGFVGGEQERGDLGSLLFE
jgi:hypothetical protein